MPFALLDEFTFHHRLAETPGPALVIFSGPGCSACKAWKRLLVDYLPQRPGLQLFEVDAGHSLALTREFEVFHLPALFLYRDGRYHCRLQSQATRKALDAALDAALAAPAEEAP